MSVSETHPEDDDQSVSGSQESTAYNGHPDELHDLFAGKITDAEDPLSALRNDPNYAALISELEYIAVEARKIFAAAEQDPSDKVWDRLKIEIESETK